MAPRGVHDNWNAGIVLSVHAAEVGRFIGAWYVRSAGESLNTSP